MIDLSKVKGLADDVRGAIKQITDAAGNVLWVANDDFDGTLKVKKIVSNTYAGETEYTNEKFVLLDIYPKTNGIVSITYGGLTKTITDTTGASEPNAKQVFFGTFQGVSDTIETPDRGIISIVGDLRGVAIGTFETWNGTKASTAYANCITAVGDLGGITTVPRNAFYRCDEIKHVTIPDGVTRIGPDAFYQCTGLKSVNLPDSIVIIGSSGLLDTSSNAFYGCTNLESVNIPKAVTQILDDSFYGCYRLKNVILPDSLSYIGRTAFYMCTSLESVAIPSSVSHISANPWVGCFENNAITVSSGNPYFKIDKNCLINFSDNTLVSGFADSVIPSYVTVIGMNAFDACKSLTSITIPDSVTEIRAYGFRNCTSLTEVRVLPTTPPSLYANVFVGTTCQFIVPKGCGEVYKAAEGWSDYADRIMEVS